MRISTFLLIPLLCFLIFSRATIVRAQTLAPAKFQDSFKIGDDFYQIKATKNFVTLSYADGEKIEFSVYRNGKFLHPNDPSGGVLIGCRQPFTTPKESNPISRIILNGNARGWWVKSMETCGSGSLNSNVIVLPESKKYVTRKIISNFKGVFVRQQSNEKGIEIWYSKYVDCGAHATAISVPHVEVVNGPQKLPSDIKAWPREVIEPNFQQVFLAGMTYGDVEVLEASKSLLDEKNFETAESCIAEGVPRTKKKIEEIIQAIKVLNMNHVIKYILNSGS